MKWLTENKLKALLTQPESSSIERCESAKSTEKIAKAVCAFSNNLSDIKKPAVIFIGLTDKGGFANLRITDQMLRNIASIRSSGQVQPFPVIDIKVIKTGMMSVIAVQVQAAGNPPVRYKNTCYVRIGPSVRMASEQEEHTLMERRQASTLPHDMQGISMAGIEADLNMEYFKTHYRPAAVSAEVIAANDRSITTQMRSLRLLDHQQKPTTTAVLLMGKAPRHWFPGAYIQFIRFEGLELTSPVKNQMEISGTLHEQIAQTENLLQVNISTALALSNKQHLKSSDYPLSALQQLVRNAVIHRDYKSTNPVRIYWFNDRIEIQSPGGPFGELNTDNFGREGITAYRNPTIAEALKNLGFIEKFGYGIAKSRNALKENGNPELEFKVETAAILAIINKA